MIDIGWGLSPPLTKSGLVGEEGPKASWAATEMHHLRRCTPGLRTHRNEHGLFRLGRHHFVVASLKARDGSKLIAHD
jgi:hypothetical protein